MPRTAAPLIAQSWSVTGVFCPQMAQSPILPVRRRSLTEVVSDRGGIWRSPFSEKLQVDLTPRLLPSRHRERQRSDPHLCQGIASPQNPRLAMTCLHDCSCQGRMHLDLNPNVLRWLPTSPRPLAYPLPIISQLGAQHKACLRLPATLKFRQFFTTRHNFARVATFCGIIEGRTFVRSIDGECQ